MSEPAAASNNPGGLLAALVPSGVLRQPEVAVTTGICWILGLEGAAGSLDSLIAESGVLPQPGGRWWTEVVGEGGRSDLEYQWGEPLRTHVVVEAKIGHTLTPEQVVGYANRLPDSGGLLVVLTPAARRSEAIEVVARCRDMVGAATRFGVWTYDDVLDALETTLPGSGDVAQLRGLVRAHRATDIEPFEPAELTEAVEGRRTDVWWVVDHASFGIGGSRLPSGADWSLHYRRYLPVERYDVPIAVGVGRKSTSDDPSRPWAWLRVTGANGYGRVARRALASIRPETEDAGDESWLPLPIETGAFGSHAADRLRADLETLLDELTTAIAVQLDNELSAAGRLDPGLAGAALGIAPLSAEDLLVSNQRHHDVWTLLTEAIRPLYSQRIYPRLNHDPDYAYVRYIPVPASDSYISTCLLPRDATPATPAAWLRVHRATSQAEIGRQVLQDLSAGAMIEDPHGWAAPVLIPTGVDGPAMVAAIHAQVNELVNGYAAAMATSNQAQP